MVYFIKICISKLKSTHLFIELFLFFICYYLSWNLQVLGLSFVTAHKSVIFNVIIFYYILFIFKISVTNVNKVLQWELKCVLWHLRLRRTDTCYRCDVIIFFLIFRACRENIQLNHLHTLWKNYSFNGSLEN